ncbi:hypothetical protein BH10PLA2_BH10PLA2_26650 [soil metagenome]
MASSSGLHGPRTLTKFRQVCVPLALLREVGLDSGDDVYFELSTDRTGILITPASTLSSDEPRTE